LINYKTQLIFLLFFFIIQSMPQTKSAKKALRQNKKRRVFNLKIKEKIKELKKKIKKLISENKEKEAKESLSLFYKIIDKAAKRGTIKKGKADREKSKLGKAISKIDQEKIKS